LFTESHYAELFRIAKLLHKVRRANWKMGIRICNLGATREVEGLGKRRRENEG
jgi:hypothetical protein